MLMTRQKWKFGARVNKPAAEWEGSMHASEREHWDNNHHCYGDDDDYDNQNQLFLISRIKLNRIS